jgi:hypothetical protein
MERRARHQNVRDVMDRGYLKGKISVRRKQMQLMEAGSPAMAIWLGKQLLNQRDQLRVESEGVLDVAVSPREELLRRIRELAPTPEPGKDSGGDS